jgi:hypothetical protein
MSQKFVLHLGAQELRIEDPMTGAHLEVANRVAVHLQRGMILSLGEDVEAVRTRLAGRFAASDIQPLSLFGPEETHLGYELRVIGHLRRMLAGQMGKPASIRLFAPRPGKGADYVLEIPGYELFGASRRRMFEHALQAHLRLRHLVINGQNVAIPARQRELEIQARRLFVRWLPGAAAIAAFITAPARLRADRLVFLGFVLVVLVLVYYGGRVAWMLLARRIVPVDYCRYMLENVRGRFSPMDQWLARILWGTKGTDG